MCSFNSNWSRSLKSLFWVDIMVVSTNHLRRVSAHSIRMGNRVPIDRRKNKRLIWHKNISISKLWSKVWRKLPRIGSNMPARTRLTDGLVYHRLDYDISISINNSSDKNNRIGNHGVAGLVEVVEVIAF